MPPRCSAVLAGATRPARFRFSTLRRAALRAFDILLLRRYERAPAIATLF